MSNSVNGIHLSFVSTSLFYSIPQSIPWPDPIAVFVSATVHGQDERVRSVIEQQQLDVHLVFPRHDKITLRTLTASGKLIFAFLLGQGYATYNHEICLPLHHDGSWKPFTASQKAFPFAGSLCRGRLDERE